MPLLLYFSDSADTSDAQHCHSFSIDHADADNICLSNHISDCATLPVAGGVSAPGVLLSALYVCLVCNVQSQCVTILGVRDLSERYQVEIACLMINMVGTHYRLIKNV